MTPDIATVMSGTIVGIVLGTVGGGGSIIAMPLLLYVVGMPSVHAAIGTSAVAVSLGALGNLVVSARRRLVKWPCAIVFSVSGLLGTFAGSHLALQLPGAKILSLFGGLMLVVGTLMLLQKNAEGDPDVRLTLKTARHMAPWLIATGLAVGALAGFFGIGGGFLIVPALILATGMPITSAIGTSLVAITIFGAATAGTYAWSGEVVWKTVVLFVGGGIAGSVVGQWAGARLGDRKSLLQSIFAGVVMLIGISTIYKGSP
jgi:uncharacterized protein